MADSDNTTTLPSVTPSQTSRTASTICFADCGATPTDPVLSLSRAWSEAHTAMAEQCLRQQRLETELLECGQSSQNVDGKPARRAGGRGGIMQAYAKAKAAEALAVAREQELLERLPMTPAHSLAGIAAKLTVILTELEDNTDLTDFPAPHLRSALEDLLRLMGQANVDASPLPDSDQEIADDLYHA
ncbi:hypothetical protein [Neoaquamicrobium sediminum]|uniref:hypothetical protein n=1 Tax=Neoaquamicrobium sediminum TaxID=1849104 RepID=UPI001564655B|nr:hypothetical protein [Mesorhizobium sediminum]NRC56477.1 hypothetical protein [Mesorhizobium sediminum]